jgi:cardiolipin synthase A/B
MPTWLDGHTLSLLKGSAQYFAALAQAMDAARHEVRLETYIFDFTGSGQQVGESLIRAAARGVRVSLLVDGVGTGDMPADWRERFNAAGVQWRIYNPLGSFGLLIPSRWRRLHRKLCVVDGGTDEAVGFCGGINILDDFHDPNHGALNQPRFDFTVRVQGPLVDAILDATSSLWQRQTAMQLLKKRELQAAVNTWVSSRAITFGQRSALGHQPELVVAEEVHRADFVRAALVLRDNLQNRKRIERAYLKAIGEARQEIIIANAYFLPGGKLRKALLNAAQRGVKVRLLLQGKYEYFMQYHAARPVYEMLLAAGIEIHEYAASFLHAKVAVCDAYSSRAWATVGSSNLDPLSLLLAREANVVVQDQKFAQGLRDQLVEAIQREGLRVDPAQFAHRPWGQRVLDRVAYALMRLALSVTGKRY